MDPSYAAYQEHLPTSGGDGAPSPEPIRQVLYTVSFRAVDVWGSVLQAPPPLQLPLAGREAEDTIAADIFECWLDLAGALQPQIHHYHDTEDARPARQASSLHPHREDGHGGGHDIHPSRAVIERNACAREQSAAQNPFQDLAEGLVGLLVAKGVLTRGELAAQLAGIDRIKQQRLGATLVAKAWADPTFRQQLVENAEAAAASIGIPTSNYKDGDMAVAVAPRGTADASHGGPLVPTTYPHGHTVLKVVANTSSVHNLVVCTLCSCYPAAVLGLSPGWYKSSSFRARAVMDPRGLLRDVFGLDVPAGVRVAVHDSTAELRYLVLPMRPAGTARWSVEQLETIVSRDSMIGVAVAKVPAAGEASAKL